MRKSAQSRLLTPLPLPPRHFPPLLQALAKLYGSYSHLDSGRVGAALEDLTGGISDKIYLRDGATTPTGAPKQTLHATAEIASGEMYRRLKALLDEGHLLGASFKAKYAHLPGGGGGMEGGSEGATVVFPLVEMKQAMCYLPEPSLAFTNLGCRCPHHLNSLFLPVVATATSGCYLYPGSLPPLYFTLASMAPLLCTALPLPSVHYSSCYQWLLLHKCATCTLAPYHQYLVLPMPMLPPLDCAKGTLGPLRHELPRYPSHLYCTLVPTVPSQAVTSA